MKQFGIILMGLILCTGLFAQEHAADSISNKPADSVKQIYQNEKLSREEILLQKLNADQLMQLELQRLNSRKDEIPLHPLALVLICLMPFTMVVLIIYFDAKAKNKREQQRYDLYVKSLESGQPLPDSIFEKTEKKTSRLQNGLVWLGVGIGLIIMSFVKNDNFAFLFAGIIPGFVGLGILIAYFIEKQKKDQSEITD